MEVVVSVLIGLIVGGIAVFVVKKMQDDAQKKSAKLEAERIVSKARAESARIEKDSKNRAKDFESRARKNAESEMQKQKSQLKNKESQLERRIRELDEMKAKRNEENERELEQVKIREEKMRLAEVKVQDLEKRAEKEVKELSEKLSRVAQMTTEEARRELEQAMEEEVKQSSVGKLKALEEELEKEASKKAKLFLAQAVARFASEYTSERTVSVLALPNEEVKGKIIGREGRNIRTLEALCGVDVIVDDTPEAVVISGFDPVRRELAKRTLEKLLEDGRVHPARIEEVVEKTKSDLNRSIKEEADRVVTELAIGNLHNEILKVLGTLRYRQTNTQNLLNHSLEVAYLSGLLASELGLNVKVARRAGLLHDIGKGIDHTIEGSHALVGGEFCKKFGESEAVCHAIRAHHNEEEPQTVLAFIVQTANILSNSRAGARRPGMDQFIHRLQELESIGNSFDGVLKTFAVQAGREVRVLVEASKVTDDQSYMLSRDIARKIERELPHLNQVRVAVIRESRSVEMAR